MLKEKRTMHIMEMLRMTGEVEISSLCRKFGVTEITIRRDLDYLAKTEKITRTHGGAILLDQDLLVDTPFERRMVANVEAKNAIADTALERIGKAKSIFLDSGTTTYIMAQKLSTSSRLVALTNALEIGLELLGKPYVAAFMIGGELKRSTRAIHGGMAEELLDRFRVDVAFMGVNGFGDDGVLYVNNFTDVTFKRRIVKIAKQTLVVADSSKFNCESLAIVGHVSEVDSIITDAWLPEGAVERLQELKGRVVLAHAGKEINTVRSVDTSTKGGNNDSGRP